MKYLMRRMCANVHQDIEVVIQKQTIFRVLHSSLDLIDFVMFICQYNKFVRL